MIYDIMIYLEIMKVTELYTLDDSKDMFTNIFIIYINKYTHGIQTMYIYIYA